MKTKLSYILSIVMLVLTLSSSQCDPDPDLENAVSTTKKELKEGEEAKSGTKEDSPIIALTVKEITAAKIVISCEMKGTSVSYKISKGDFVKSDALNRKENHEISFKNLDGETVYAFTAFGIDAEGKQGKTLTIKVKTRKEPYSSYVRYLGDRFIPVTEATMYKKSFTKTNTQYLIMKGYAADGWYVEIAFNHDVPYYVPVSAEWEDGTYNITPNSDYYTYIIRARVKTDHNTSYYGMDGPGTLKIETKGNKKIIDYLNDDDLGKIHFEGEITY